LIEKSQEKSQVPLLAPKEKWLNSSSLLKLATIRLLASSAAP